MWWVTKLKYLLIPMMCRLAAIPILNTGAKQNRVYTTGLYNFGQDNKYTDIATGGDYTFNLKDSSNLFSLMLWFQFPFPLTT